MKRKFEFYEKYGVEEYYIYDPDELTLEGFLRNDEGLLRAVAKMEGHVSPRLGVRFEMSPELVLSTAEGEVFKMYNELVDESLAAQQKLLEERERAVDAERHAKRQRERAEAEKAQRLTAEKLAHEAKAKAEAEKTERLALEKALAEMRAKLKAAGIDPDAV
jgi:hypothetical protein